jgi:hypothetical protein
MSGFGVPQEQIATMLEIEPKTLREALPARAGPRLGRGDGEGGPVAVPDGHGGNNVAAAIFWMKARAGWTERHRVEHGLAGQLAAVSGVPWGDQLSDEELMRIAARGLERDADEDGGSSGWAPGGERRSFASGNAPKELSQEEWLALYGPSSHKPTGSGGA